jgi:hypothetical protein
MFKEELPMNAERSRVCYSPRTICSVIGRYESGMLRGVCGGRSQS